MFKLLSALKASLLIGVICFASCDQAESPDITDYIGHGELSIEKEGYHSMELGIDIYRFAAFDFHDIRIKTGQGSIVPWYREEAKTFSSISQQRVIPFQLIDSRRFQKNKRPRERVEYDFQVSQNSKEMKGYDALEVVFAEADWSFRAEAYGRFSGSQWQLIASDSLYSLDSYQKSRFDLGENVKYPFLRLVLIDRSNYPELSTLSAIQTVDGRELINERMIKLEFKALEKSEVIRVEGGEKYSDYRIENPDRLKIFQINLLTIGNFHRRIHLLDEKGYLLQRSTIYSFNHDEISYQNCQIRLQQLNAGRFNSFLTLRIFDKDNVPIELVEVEAVCFFDRIVFGPVGAGSLSVTWGDEKARYPDYDIKKFSHRLEAEKLPSAILSNIKTESERDPAEDNVNWVALQVLFVLVIALIISVIGALTISQLKKGRGASF